MKTDRIYQIAFMVCIGIGLPGPSIATTEAEAKFTAYIAGLQPWQRPASAPVVEKFTPTPEWRKNALTGIDEPRNGIKFLENQGAWYTPFIYPNLKGKYDIRGFYHNPVKE